jgi:Ammonium Transporter Family
MQAGFAMVCAGAVRRKNTRNSMLKNLLDAAGAAVSYYCFGYAFAFGGDGSETGGTRLFGLEHFFSRGDIDLPFYFFQYTFFAASVRYPLGVHYCSQLAANSNLLLLFRLSSNRSLLWLELSQSDVKWVSDGLCRRKDA